MNEVSSLLTALLVDTAFATVLTAAVYQRAHGNRDYVFTYLMFNVVTFALCALLQRVQMELGFALGLFAVFGVLRYRTESIRIIDLTYLFIAIGLAMLNGIAGGHVSLPELLTANALVVGLTALLEFRLRARRLESVPVFYDNLGLLAEEHRKELLNDLKVRTGLPVCDVEIVRLDMLREAAELQVSYPVTEARGRRGAEAPSPAVPEAASQPAL